MGGRFRHHGQRELFASGNDPRVTVAGSAQWERKMPKSQVGRIDATWTEAARTELERFVTMSRVAGAVLSLAKKEDVSAGSRWLYAVYSGERIKPMQAAMAKHGVPLLYSVDGLTIAVSNSKHVTELAGSIIDLDDPGYLLVRRRAATPGG
jgi:hypothetical protein